MFHFNWRAAGLCLLLSLLVARPAHAQAGQTGTIAGTVIARDGGQMVADAVVMVEGTALRAVSNGVGRFRLEGVPAGQRVLVVQGPGFLDLRVASVQVRANETAALIVELEVTPNFLDRVQVTATKTLLSMGDVAAQADVVERSHEKLSLSRMTLPHRLARLVLAEQIYRAMTIRKGEPYHH